jgi:hypothetical protein
MSVEVPPSALARCATHPEELAGATCHRCGGFVCVACTTWVLGRLYCPTCAARPEVNYLEVFRRERWGRPDTGAYLVGGSTPLFAGGGLVALLGGHWLLALQALAAAGVCVAYSRGVSWARLALLLLPLALGLPAVSSFGWLMLGLILIPFISTLRLFLDTRNKLFFRIEVSERALRRLWDHEVNNPLARVAATLGVSALLLPLFAPFAIVVGFIALWRVDLQATPPIGRRGYALAGIVLGLGALALWALLILPFVMGSLRGFSGL